MGTIGKSILIQGAVQYYGSLVRIVRNRGIYGDEAHDVVQDAYVRLTAAIDRTDIRDPLAFLRTTAINLVRDRARTSTTRREVFQHDAVAPEQVACSVPPADQTIIGRQQLAILEQALAELPPKRRAALVLYRFDNLSHAEIASQLGISISMVEKHVRLALEHCRQRLAESGGDRP